MEKGIGDINVITLEKKYDTEKQLVFLVGCSTTLQLLRALDHWTAELDNGNEIEFVYLISKKPLIVLHTNDC